MAKEKVDIKKQANEKMESLVEQHNELVGEIQETQSRLAEVKQLILEHQGYLKGLDACDKQCEEKK
jgi:prefoldin subunit 5|tara:strand:+ start:692 stop:889 length:198 start_codon:yes stop_codon:yes gene_type:complete